MRNVETLTQKRKRTILQTVLTKEKGGKRGRGKVERVGRGVAQE